MDYHRSQFPPPAEWLTATQRLEGPLDGVVTQLRFDMIDGEVLLNREITLTLPEGLGWRDFPTQRALRHLRLSHVPSEVAEWMAGIQNTRWVEAMNRDIRPGRGRRPVEWYLLWAQRRIEADAYPEPIKYLSDTYGETRAAVNAILHRAKINHGLILLERGRPPELTPKALKLIKEGERRGQHRQAT
jgi:hypothetical protein